MRTRLMATSSESTSIPACPLRMIIDDAAVGCATAVADGIPVGVVGAAVWPALCADSPSFDASFATADEAITPLAPNWSRAAPSAYCAGVGGGAAATISPRWLVLTSLFARSHDTT